MSTKAKQEEKDMQEYNAIRKAVKQCRKEKNMGKRDVLPRGDFFNVALKFSPLTPRVNSCNWVKADWNKHHANYAKTIRAKIEALPANASPAEIEAVIVGSVLASANLTYQVVRNYLSRKRYVVITQPPHDFEVIDKFEAEQIQSIITYLEACKQYGDDFTQRFIAEELVTSPAEIAGYW